MIARFHHVNIRAVDPVPVVTFYRALGFRLTGCAQLGDLFTLYLNLPGDDRQIELTVNPSADESWPREMGTAHLALVVPDLAEALDELAEKGIEPVAGPMNPGGREDITVCFLEDPTGYKVELIDGIDWIPPRDQLPKRLSYD